MFGSETRYYVDAEHCSQEMIEKWSEISGWELIGDEFVFPDYGKVRELTMQRDKKPSSHYLANIVDQRGGEKAMRILEIVMLVGFPIGLIAGVIGSIILTVYQFIEARRVEKMFASIKSYDSQRDAIYKTWGDKHSIMPYAGPDVGWFIGSCGFGIPMGISIVATSIVASIYYALW